MYSFTRSTAATKSSCVNDDGGVTGVTRSPCRGGSSSGNGRLGARNVATIASMRAHARSYAASAFSGRATYGVATTFSVCLRLSKISSVSVTIIASGGKSSPGRARAGRSSNARTQSYAIQPTAPPQNRGSPGTSTGRISRNTSSSAAVGSAVSHVAVRGGPPASTSNHVTLAVPLAQRTSARGATPTNEYAAHVAPPTTDSSKNECSPPPSAAYAETGVSPSASSSRYTGIRFPRAAAATNSSRLGVYMRTWL